jgi:transcriptional regulator with XRE-family HTH domain
MSTVGKRIKEKRNEMGMSQVDFAKAIGVSKQTLYKYENDIITNIPSDKIESAARLCNVAPGFFMGWNTNDVRNSQQPAYYTNPETAAIAQQIYDDHNLHALFDAARDSDSAALKAAAAMLKTFKETNPDG